MTDPLPRVSALPFFNCGSMSWPCPPRYLPGQLLGPAEAEALNSLMHTALAAKLAPLLAQARDPGEADVQKMQGDVVEWARDYTPTPRPRHVRPSSLALLLAEAEAPDGAGETEVWALALTPRIQALAVGSSVDRVVLAQALVAGLL